MSHERPREPPPTAARGEQLLETHVATMLERARAAPKKDPMGNYNPYAPPRLATATAPSTAPAFLPGGPRLAQVVDGALVLPPGHPLPPLCIKCGGSESLEARHHELRYRSGFLYLALLLGLIPGLVLLLAETKRAPVVLPLCPPCNDRWKRAVTVRRIAAILTVVLAMVSLFALQVCFVTHTHLYGPLLILAIAIVVPVVGHVLQRPHLLSVTRIADGVVTLRGVAPAVLDAVAARPKKKKKKKKPAGHGAAASASPTE
jgi:hypothetical protein